MCNHLQASRKQDFSGYTNIYQALKIYQWSTLVNCKKHIWRKKKKKILETTNATLQPPIRQTYWFQKSTSPCSSVIAFTRSSENLTSDSDFEVTEIQTQIFSWYNNSINLKLLHLFVLTFKLNCPWHPPSMVTTIPHWPWFWPFSSQWL